MSETRLLDYSKARPSFTAMKGFGAVGVLRYLTRSTSAKVLTAVEAHQLRAAGFWVGVVFEDTAGRATQGSKAGRLDAEFAAAQAKAIGIPTTCPIFFAVDSDVAAATVIPYFQGIRSAGIANPVGVYGSCSVVDGVVGAGLARYVWQTVAWSHGRRSPHAHLLQTADATVPGTDKNLLLKPLPLWGAPAPAPAPAPTPAPQPAPVPAPAPNPMPGLVDEESDMHIIHSHAHSIALVTPNGKGGIHLLKLTDAEAAALVKGGVRRTEISDAEFMTHVALSTRTA